MTKHPSKQPLVPFRFLLVMATFLLALLLYIDRICISVAKTPIANDLNLSDTQMGWVLSAFALGYALFQTPSGMLADRFGPRSMLALIVTLWSAFTAMTGAVWNFISLLLVRALFGAGEAGAFPGIARATYNWIPLKERGIVTGINFSGSRLGAAFALPLVAWLIDAAGWRMGFFILGGIGIVWALLWWWGFRNQPEEHKFLSAGEKELILRERQQPDAGEAEAKAIPFSQMLQSRNMWLAMGQYFCSNFTFFFSLTWLFPHIKTTYNLGAIEAGWYASAPLVFGAFGNWFSGWWVDKIYTSGKWQRSRQLPAIVGFLLAAVGLVGSVFMQEPLSAIIFLSLAIFGADMTLSPSWSFCVDIGRKSAGAVSGTMNMAGNLGSFLTALVFPYLQTWTGSVTPFFFIGAALNVLAIFFWLGTNPKNPIGR